MYRVLFSIWIVFCSCLSFSKGVQALSINELKPDQIYVFTRQGCIHCEAAKRDLTRKYPNLKIQWRDVTSRYNLDLALACVAKFKLNKSQFGTPLFCMGDHYILGWSSETQKEFDEYVVDFVKNNEAKSDDK